MKLSIKHSPIGKPLKPDPAALTFGWQTVDYSPQQIVDHALAGYPLAVGVYKNDHRKTSNFISSQLIIIDVDHGIKASGLNEGELQQLLACEYVKKYAFAVYPSFNSQAGAYRLRVCFALDQVVTNAKLYRDLVSVVQTKIPFADAAAKDAARAFYGSTPGVVSLYGRFN